VQLFARRDLPVDASHQRNKMKGTSESWTKINQNWSN
jgi:hypothetical protein